MFKSWKCSYFFPHMGIDEGHCVSFQFASEKKKKTHCKLLCLGKEREKASQ